MNLKVNSEIELVSLALSDADDIFDILNSQRKYMSEWLPFIQTTKNVDSITKFIKFVRSKSKEKLEYAFTIRKEGKLIGLVDLKETDLINKKTEIGYWLSLEFASQGIMTASVKRICEFVFEELNLNRIQIKCATENIASKRIPQKLGFKLEGIERDGELFPDGTFVDLETYSLLKKDF